MARAPRGPRKKSTLKENRTPVEGGVVVERDDTGCFAPGNRGGPGGARPNNGRKTREVEAVQGEIEGMMIESAFSAGGPEHVAMWAWKTVVEIAARNVTLSTKGKGAKKHEVVTQADVFRLKEAELRLNAAEKILFRILGKYRKSITVDHTGDVRLLHTLEKLGWGDAAKMVSAIGEEVRALPRPKKS